jgi:hypothetical protein
MTIAFIKNSVCTFSSVSIITNVVCTVFDIVTYRFRSSSCFHNQCWMAKTYRGCHFPSPWLFEFRFLSNINLFYLTPLSLYTVELWSVSRLLMSRLSWIYQSELEIPTKSLFNILLSISRIFRYLKAFLGPIKFDVTKFDCSVFSLTDESTE